MSDGSQEAFSRPVYNLQHMEPDNAILRNYVLFSATLLWCGVLPSRRRKAVANYMIAVTEWMV